MGQTTETGRAGEQAAAEWLHASGFELLHRNWRSGRYELDIVARKGCTLHVVEVKTRRAGSLTLPEEAMTPAKFASLMKGAQAYLAENAIDLDVQFDLVAVEHSPEGINIRYIPDAVSPSW